MKLRIAHTFACTPEEYLALIEDPEFEALLARESRMERSVLEDEGGRRVVRCIPDRKLPGVVAKAVGTDRIVYDQVTERRPDGLRWSIRPQVAADKVDIGGTMVVRAHPAGCERVVEGEVRVKVPLVGGRIEKAIVGDVEKSYERTAEALRGWLRGRG